MALVSSRISFIETYSRSQASVVSLIVNFGLVLMLIFDYIRSTETLKKWMFGLFGSAMLVAIGVYAHGLIVEERHLNDFLMPISYPYFGFILHIIFLFFICGMKFVCLSDENNKTINLRSV